MVGQGRETLGGLSCFGVWKCLFKQTFNHSLLDNAFLQPTAHQHWQHP